MAVGLAVGLAASLAISVGELTLFTWVLWHVALIAPTAAQPWVQWKPYKVFARFLLGVGSATWLVGALIPGRTSLEPLVQLLASGLVFVAVGKTLLSVRERKAKSPCTTCPLGAFPTCSWNLPRLASSGVDASLIEAIMQSIEVKQVTVGEPRVSNEKTTPV